MLRSVKAFQATRLFSTIGKLLAKNDASTIDSFRLPSQTSISEWEFKYDFMPKVEQPKIPPVSPEAVKQDIAQTKEQQVEQEMFFKELNSSVKVEANDASVVHGGEPVTTEPEYIHDRGSEPVDATNLAADQKQKIVNSDKYVQSSLNLEINKHSVVNLSENKVDHKTATVEVPPEVEDVEGSQKQPTLSSSPVKILGLLGLGGISGYFFFGGSKEQTNKAH